MGYCLKKWDGREAFNVSDISLQWLESQCTEPNHFSCKEVADALTRKRHNSLQ